MGLSRPPGRFRKQIAREERVGLSMVVADSTGAAHLHRMAPASHGEIVGKFVAPHDRQIGEENLSPQFAKPGISSPT